MKKRDPRRDAAYKVHPGITAEQAEDKGYVVVEWNTGTNPFTPVYGEYLDDDAAGVPVTAGNTPLAASKGDLVNPNDPVIHGTADADVHADGSDAVDRDEQLSQTKDAVEAGAFDGETVEKAAKAKK